MHNKIKKYIAKHNMLNTQKQHLVALSGGADSVCLLHVMKRLGFKVQAVHCNFHLRGEESNRDEAFCIDLCKRLDIKLHLIHFDTKTYAEVHKISIEMAARELRYSYFEQLRQSIDADSIVVAHHRDDNVETLLINLIRGTGIHGLEGIKPVNGRIIRPLLCVSRKNIQQYLSEIGEGYITDSSNMVDDIVRNKIRLNIIPMLESINPAVSANIESTIENISEAIRIVDAEDEQARKRCLVNNTIDIEKLKNEISPEQVLFSILSDYHFSPSQIKQIYDNLSAQSGKVWHSATHTVATDRSKLIIGKSSDTPQQQLRIPEEGIYIYNVRAKITITKEEITDTFRPSRDKSRITIDAGKVSFPLTLRSTKTGDRFRPFGMKGTKLVSDYLTDRKADYFQRLKQLILTDANDNIIWLVGERVSDNVACTTNTKVVLEITYSSNE